MLAQVKPTTYPSEIQHILNILLTLPLEKVLEVLDYVQFLQQRYSQSTAIDSADDWSEDDLRDLARASLFYAKSALALTEEADV